MEFVLHKNPLKCQEEDTWFCDIRHYFSIPNSYLMLYGDCLGPEGYFINWETELTTLKVICDGKRIVHVLSIFRLAKMCGTIGPSIGLNVIYYSNSQTEYL